MRGVLEVEVLAKPASSRRSKKRTHLKKKHEKREPTPAMIEASQNDRGRHLGDKNRQAFREGAASRRRQEAIRFAVKRAGRKLTPAEAQEIIKRLG